ncbi:MAG: hypothetical protein JWR63_4064 [Conexibacter sp.]|nr:hypothetical protein [Conexibacter sp.]
MPAAGVDVPKVVGDVLDAVVGAVGDLAVRDWILVALAVGLLVWVWVRAAAVARQGTIEIGAIATDGLTLKPSAVRSALTEALGDRGWLPASGVPSGAPTADKLAAVVSAMPGTEVKLLGALISAIPTPPRSTTFKVSAVIADSDPASGPCSVAYELSCLGPVPGVRLGQQSAATWSEAIKLTAKEIYRNVQELAPGIYPDWAFWRTTDALTSYRQGLDIENDVPGSALGQVATTDAQRLAFAYAKYERARAQDPGNMLAQLGVATTLERLRGETVSGRPGPIARIDALEIYTGVRVRHPAIFEAGFRASILLSAEATEVVAAGASTSPRLDQVLSDLDELHADERMLGDRLRAGWQAVVDGLRPVLQFPVPPRLDRRVQRVAGREALMARRRVRPHWSVVYEHRFRHRFEPAGPERRQLRHALLISQMCLRARTEAGKTGAARRWLKIRLKVIRGWLFCRHLFCRARLIGWQAHYNAACFYALLSDIDDKGAARLRRAALKELRIAIAQAGSDLPRAYVEQDTDLGALRHHARPAFDKLLAV